jgi:LysM repeat protein
VPATPALEPERGPRFSVWTVVAPVALLLCVSLVVLIARAAWVDDGPERVRRGGAATTARTTSTPTRTASTRTTSTTATGTTATTTGAAADGTRTYWRVQAGDTFASIADRFGTSIEDLVQLNPTADPQALRIGQRVRVR